METDRERKNEIVNETEALKVRVSALEDEVKRLEELIEHVAKMITSRGTEDPGPAQDELPLRDRVEELESQFNDE